MKGRIIKNIADRYTVLAGNAKYTAFLSGKLKITSEICVGDYVDFKIGHKNVCVIEKLYPRKNSISRPFVSNIDLLLIFVSPIPEPDPYLVDKLIVSANYNDIEPVICVNKSDITDVVFNYYEKNYKGVCKVFSLNCVDGLLGDLPDYIREKTVALVGQSASGKSTFVNALTGLNVKIGELSNIERGKNTTRHTEIYIKDGFELVDTCGFSSLAFSIPHYDLYKYYYDYMDYQDNCKFKTCTHTDEPDCAVKKAVEEGKLSFDRYQRYVRLFLELKDIYDNRF